MSDTNPTPGSGATLPTLEADNLYRWQQEMFVYLAAKGLGATFPAIRDVTKLDEDVGGSDTVYAKQLKRRAQHDRVAAASAIVESVGADRRHLLVLGADGAFDPVKAWDAVAELCLGAKEGRGEEIDDDLVAITAIPSTGQDGETIDPQSDAGVAELFRQVIAIKLRADVHQQNCTRDSETNQYVISTTRFLNTIIRILIGDNPDYRSYRPEWRKCATLEALRTTVMADRREVARDTAAGNSAARSFLTTGAEAAMAAMADQVKALTAQVARMEKSRGGGGGGGGRRHYTDAELEIEGSPPDGNAKWVWCPRHRKWGTHKAADCRVPPSQ
jgi:hypothetical protein